MKRRWVIVLLLIVALAAAGLFGAAEGVRWYASGQLVGGLSQLYGGRVEADTATAGWRQVTLDGVRLYDADGQHVVLSVGRMVMDLTLRDLVEGRMIPNHLVLQQPTAIVRFNHHDHLLTRLPPTSPTGSLPRTITVEHGAVKIEQDGRQPTTIDGADVQVTTGHTGLQLAGTVISRQYGTWQVSGQADSALNHATLKAATSGLAISPAWLRSLPLLPKQLWQEVTAAGKLNAQATLRLHPPAGEPWMHADLELSRATATLPELDLRLTDATITAAVDDYAAKLKSVHGHVAGGELTASGTVDFATLPIQSNLQVNLDGADLSQLPKSWSLPHRATGNRQSNSNRRLAPQRGRGPRIQPVSFEPANEKPTTDDAQHRDAAKPRVSSLFAGTVDFNLRLADAPLEPLLKSLSERSGTELPPITGSVSTDLHVKIPLATLSDLATFQAEGNITSQTLKWHGVELQNVRATAHLDRGLFTLSPLQAEVGAAGNGKPGELAGIVTAQVAPAGDVTLRLSVREAPLAILASLDSSELPVTGAASISVAAQAPLARLSELSAWQATGEVAVPKAELDGLHAEQIAAAFRAEQGMLHVYQGRATVADTLVTAAGEVQLHSPYQTAIDFRVPVADLAHLAQVAGVQLPQPLAGSLETTGRITGSLAPLGMTISGDAAVAALRAGPYTLPAARFHYAVNGPQLQITQLAATAFDGQLTASAVLPLTQTAPPLWAGGQFHDVQVEQVAGLLPTLPATARGQVSGSFALVGLKPATMQGELHIQSPELTIDALPVEHVRGDVALTRGVVSYKLAATVAGGTLAAEGQAQPREPLTSALAWQHLGINEIATTGRVTLHHAHLAALAHLLAPGQTLPLTGMADLDLQFRQSPGSPHPAGSGRLLLTDVAWNRRLVASELQSGVTLSGDWLELRDLYAPLGTGAVRADIALRLNRAATGRFDLVLEQVPAQTLLAPWPDLAHRITGPIDGRLGGTLGRDITGGGTIGTSQARISGIEVSSVRIPVQFAFAPATRTGQVQFLDSTAEVAAGRVTGSGRATLDRVLSLSGNMRLVNLQLRSLASAAGSFGLGGGRVSGRVDFAAAEFRSPSDITASFNLSLAQAQAAQIPVLSEIARYVLPISTASASFDTGELRGRLAGGVARIERFSLVGSGARVLADGTVTLSEHLNLDIVAQNGNNQPVAGLLVQRVLLPILAPETVPLALLTRANQLLADQLVFLHVGGTVRSPTIQVRPAPQLGYEALRFFSYGALGVLP